MSRIMLLKDPCNKLGTCLDHRQEAVNTEYTIHNTLLPEQGTSLFSKALVKIHKESSPACEGILTGGSEGFEASLLELRLAGLRGLLYGLLPLPSLPPGPTLDQ